MSEQERAIPDDELLSIEDAARHVGLSVRTLRRYQSAGRLAVVKVGRNVMCTRAAAERATRSGGLELASQQMVEAEWDSRPVREWMAAWIDYMRLAPDEVQPPERYVRYMEMVASRFGELEVRAYRLHHLGEIHAEAVNGGFDVPEVGMMLVLPAELPVIDAVRQIQLRFAGREANGSARDGDGSGASGGRESVVRDGL